MPCVIHLCNLCVIFRVKFILKENKFLNQPLVMIVSNIPLNFNLLPSRNCYLNRKYLGMYISKHGVSDISLYIRQITKSDVNQPSTLNIFSLIYIILKAVM